ncbi:MAG: hypothetical protein WCP30_16730 [Mycobacteriaceae bacterium]
MRVVVFAPALSATEEEAGGVTVKGFPMTSCFVNNFPAQITVPIVVAMTALGGTDYDPAKVIVATSPSGDRVGSLEFGWHWPDNPPTPVKFRVFTQYLPIRVDEAGVYTLGLYDSLDDTETDCLFPFPILRPNPLLQSR